MSYLIKIVSLGIYLGYSLLVFETIPLRQYPPGKWETIIENQEFTQTLQLEDEDDNTLILNATFHDIDGSALMLRNVSNVYIKNCTIYNVAEDGIVLRSTGSTRNVTIDGCTIYNTGHNGILAKQGEEESVDHANLIIKNNTLYANGTTDSDHGMYIFATDSVIENNVVYGSKGNGISLRSSGIVRGNKIWDTEKSCVRYHSDHAPGASNTLLIENNVCYQKQAGEGTPGISLSREEIAPESWLLQNYIIRFNTVVLLTPDRYGFEVESQDFESKQVEVYGNLFVNTKDISKTLAPQYIDYNSNNYASTSLQGFVNPTRQPYDFQLKADSPARYHASKEADFPALDINGVTRVTRYLDAGAYQFSRPPVEKSTSESQNKSLVATATQPPENSQADEPLVQNSAQPVAVQGRGLTTVPLHSMFLLGLLLITGAIIVLRVRKSTQ
jgi:hypothetical protein